MRYSRSLDTVTEEELNLLRGRTVAIVGAGGLGGYVIEMLTRFGIGRLKIMDSDRFDETNLNRQLLSNEGNLGKSKVAEAVERVKLVNSDVEAVAVMERFNKDNARTFLEGTDVVMDCLDNVASRFVMEEVCSHMKIPMVHGAVGAWNGQVLTVLPGDGVLRELYGEKYDEAKPISAASFIPALVASYQVSECIKILIGKGELLHRKMLYIDLMSNSHFVVELLDES